MTHVHLRFGVSALPRALAAFAFALTAFGLVVSSAAAVPPTIEHDQATRASAFAQACVPGPDDMRTCTSTDISVTLSKEGEDVCLFSVIEVFEGDFTFLSRTEQIGCASLPDGAFTVDRELSTATLTSVVVPVTVSTCDPFECTEVGTDEVTVSVTWTEAGELERFKESFRSQIDGCKQTLTQQGERRETTATVALDGQALDAGVGRLERSRTSFKSIGTCSPPLPL